MGWEWRRGKRYWYEACKVKGKVKKEYIGDGFLGEAAEHLSKMARWEREKKRLDAQDAIAAAAPEVEASQSVGDLYEAADALVAAVLTQAGYHRSRRGPWRRKRQQRQPEKRPEGGKEAAMGKTSSSKSGGGMTSSAASVAGGVEPCEVVDVFDLTTPTSTLPVAAAPSTPGAIGTMSEAEFLVLKRAVNGDQEALTPMLEVLRAHPRYAEKYKQSKIMGRSAQATLIELACGQNLLARELWKREAEELAQSLAGPSPSALETVLIERIVTCRMELNYYVGNYARCLKEVNGRMSSWDEAKQKRMDKASRRFLSAVKALAQVRRLALPDHVQAIQINLGSDVPAASAALAAPGRAIEQTRLAGQTGQIEQPRSSA